MKILLLFSFLATTALGTIVVTRRTTHRRINVVFTIFTWASALWILSVLMINHFRTPSATLFWGRVSFAASSMIPASFLCFAMTFPAWQTRLTSRAAATIFLPGFIFGGLSFTGLLLQNATLNGWKLMTRYGPLHPLFSFYFLAYFITAFVYLIRNFRAATGIGRLQIKYCFLGVFITALFTISTNLILPLLGSSRFSTVGPAFTVIMVAFLTYSIVRHRLLDISFVLKKGTTYSFLVLFIIFPSVGLIIVCEAAFFHRIDVWFTTVSSLVVLFATILFSRLKPPTERAVEQMLFRSRYDYKDTLSKFSKALVTILDLRSLCGRILETVTEAMGVEKASLVLLNEEKGGYFLQESKNVDLPQRTLPKGDALSRYLQSLGEIVVREELAKGAHLPELRTVVERMTALGAEVTIPLVSKGRLIGMINLSHKFTKDIYSHEDIELLTTLANQAAIAIENARLYEDLKRSKSYIRRADRLASLGTLTAGLAHEIRNPLVAIKTFTQLLPERIEDEEFRNHFLQIASDEVNRISSLINELLEFARPSKPNFESEDLNAILDGMILLVSTESKKKHIQVVKEYGADLPQIPIDREQMKQVFLNILLNAIDATPEEGMIFVRTRSFTKLNGEGFIQIEFKDNGCGIPKENLEEIFTPFFTTKSKGSGLGLPISNQIVQDHKGYIDVESEPGKGTSFFVNLPVKQDHPKRRATDLEKREDLPGFA